MLPCSSGRTCAGIVTRHSQWGKCDPSPAGFDHLRPLPASRCGSKGQYRRYLPNQIDRRCLSAHSIRILAPTAAFSVVKLEMAVYLRPRNRRGARPFPAPAAWTQTKYNPLANSQAPEPVTPGGLSPIRGRVPESRRGIPAVFAGSGKRRRVRTGPLSRPPERCMPFRRGIAPGDSGPPVERCGVLPEYITGSGSDPDGGSRRSDSQVSVTRAVRFFRLEFSLGGNCSGRVTAPSIRRALHTQARYVSLNGIALHSCMDAEPERGGPGARRVL